ncbi:MAG: hypothetical protein ABIQ11_12085 [Saprospiraceae bacterium]
MSSLSLNRSVLLMVVLVVGFLIVWEIYLRKLGTDNSYDDGPPIWAFHRSQVYKPIEKSTVFIGSSRIKFDLDIDTWKSLTGEEAIQLACVGSSPLPQLYDLADDPEFKGKLIIDVTEVLFFSMGPFAVERPNKGIAYYKDITPTQRASFVINKPLESNFVFLDKDNFSINALLNKLELKSRPGVFMFPIFPCEFGRVKFNRQEYMTEKFVADTNLHNKVRAIWGFLGTVLNAPPISGTTLDSLFETVKIAIDKIEARGGKVLFVRTPSSGPFWAGEQQGYPRENYWDKLLEYTNTPGIHFMDHPATNHYICPEFSHLTPSDAIDYTQHFIQILKDDHGWQFPNMNKM